MCINIISLVPSSAANKKLEARPVVFFKSAAVEKSLEFVDLWERWNKIVQQQSQNQIGMPERESSYSAFDKAQHNVWLKVEAITASIAKRLGAGAVVQVTNRLNSNDVDYNGNSDDILYYVDPSYDITNEVIEQLNKEYLAAK
jgi:hypothetical protein